MLFSNVNEGDFVLNAKYYEFDGIYPGKLNPFVDNFDENIIWNQLKVWKV